MVSDSTSTALYAIRLRAEQAAAPALQELLSVYGYTPSTWSCQNTSSSVTSLYIDDLTRADALHRTIAESLDEWQELCAQPIQLLPIDFVQPEDWSESWKAHFSTIQVSSRIVVKPSWEPAPERQPICLIALDPGMSFGTGHHETTRTCLRLIDNLAQQQPAGSLIDVGCGSGILAIAAAKLGFAPVVAFDYDPAAVEVARDNAEKNGVARDVAIRQADASTIAEEVHYDVVVANLLSNLLVDNAEHIAGLADLRGTVILSGLLRSQRDEVLQAYAALGWQLAEAVVDGEWCTVQLVSH